MVLNKQQIELCSTSKWDFSDIKALFINCTLKKSPEISHTRGLIDVSKAIMEKNKVDVEVIRAADYDIANGVWDDMKKHGWDKDYWPQIFKKVMNANILVIGSPIWLGQKSSICQKIIERLYGQSGELNKNGQYAYYGRVGGCIITGNEDGIKHCGMSILYSLQHLGFVIPPQADAGWIGEAGPGPSYLDEESGGPENDFTQRNVTFMTWNLLHLTRMMIDAGGLPVHGNQRSKWGAGCRFDHPNPEYR
jgi:multimeric flavodoxin WrbA